MTKSDAKGEIEKIKGEIEKSKGEMEKIAGMVKNEIKDTIEAIVISFHEDKFNRYQSLDLNLHLMKDHYLGHSMDHSIDH